MESVHDATIGGCRVEREIGRGGMGVVYLARDERLDRPVAIKSLPAMLARDEARASRLAREAKALATLNHPNVAAIYGLEEQGGRLFLLLEYVEGPTLADRLVHGPLPIDEALSVCAQIAAGVESAHEAGIIHRDLKPANVKAPPGGRVKVLDFGLAKATPATAAVVTTSGQTVVESRVVSPTAEGVVMGTAAYMSPEQARGRSLDRRTDIWSLGCILFECLTGLSPFAGPTDSDSIAAVLEREPDWSRLPSKTPFRVRELLGRCLQKDAASRLRDIGDAELELRTALSGREWSTGAIAASARQDLSRRRVRSGITAAGLVALIGVGAVLGRIWPSARVASGAGGPAGDATPVNRLSIAIPQSLRASDQFAIAPDGRMVAYIATPVQPSGERSQIFIRPMDAFAPIPLQATQGAYTLSFSPDGRWLAFAVAPSESAPRTVLMKVQLSGGPPIALFDQPNGRIGQPVWVSPDSIAFLSGENGMQVSLISSNGGPPRRVWDAAAAGFQERPEAMMSVRGSKWLLLTMGFSDEKGWREAITRISVDGGEPKLLLDAAGFPAQTQDGVLVYTQADSMLARRFDPASGDFAGPVIPVMSGLRTSPSYCAYQWSICEHGDLAFVQGGKTVSSRRLALVDFQGESEAIGKTTGDFEGTARFSPDGTRICGTIISDAGTYELFMYHTRQDAYRRIPAPGVDCSAPVWHPDGRRIAYAVGNKSVPSRLLLRRVDGFPEPELLSKETGTSTVLYPVAFSPDGQWLLCCRRDNTGKSSRLVLVDVEKDHRVRPLLDRPGRQTSGAFSPDGKWIVYDSDDEGRFEVYVEPNPLAPQASAGGERLTVSTNGGSRPTWSRDGLTIYFLQGEDGVAISDFSPGPPATVSAPRPLFRWQSLDWASSSLEPAPDGKHLLYVQRTEEEGRIRLIQVVQNWGREVRAKLAEAAAAQQAAASD